jgi:hypothetical protein
MRGKLRFSSATLPSICLSELRYKSLSTCVLMSMLICVQSPFSIIHTQIDILCGQTLDSRENWFGCPDVSLQSRLDQFARKFLLPTASSCVDSNSCMFVEGFHC